MKRSTIKKKINQLAPLDAGYTIGGKKVTEKQFFKSVAEMLHPPKPRIPRKKLKLISDLEEIREMALYHYCDEVATMLGELIKRL